MDVVQQLINEATTPGEFREAAMAVRSHIAAGRNPAMSTALVVGLMAKGHSIVDTFYRQDHSPELLADIGGHVAHQVMLTLATDPAT